MVDVGSRLLATRPAEQMEVSKMVQSDPFKGVKSVGDGRRAGEFAPGVRKCPKEYLLGVVVKLTAAVIVEDWDSKFGTSDFALVRLQLQDGREFSSLIGGKAVVKAVRLFIKHNEFPRLAVLDTAASQTSGNAYYYLRAPAAEDRFELLEEPTPEQMGVQS